MIDQEEKKETMGESLLVEETLKVPSNAIQVKVTFDTLPPLPKMQIPAETVDGRMKVQELLNKVGLYARKEFQKTDSILIFLRSSFLANPFDSLADLALCFGVKGNNEIRELNMKISTEVNWG